MPERVLHTAAVALGSNLGDRAANLAAAVAELRSASNVEVLRVSENLANPAVGGPVDSPPFLNAAVLLRTPLPPLQLLDVLLRVEAGLGRHRLVRWEPRPIDLDLIFYDDLTLGHHRLTLPHPLMHRRRFVLQPLAAIAPELFHPTLRLTVAQLLAALTGP